jgi:hypothetical protein
MTASLKLQTEWQRWADKLWDAMEARFGYPGLAHLEQKMFRSAKEHRCCNCGDAGDIPQTSHLIASVKVYYFCPACDAYWKGKS